MKKEKRRREGGERGGKNEIVGGTKLQQEWVQRTTETLYVDYLS
jgi:hypothetical protein